MLKIGTTFKIQQKSIEHECYVGQEVVILDYNYAYVPTTYLVQDAREDDFFCCLQSVPIINLNKK